MWTNIENQESADAFNMFSSELEAGTVFLNRCDCLDPALSWSGVKNSGRGVSLSTFGKLDICGWQVQDRQADPRLGCCSVNRFRSVDPTKVDQYEGQDRIDSGCITPCIYGSYFMIIDV